MITNSLSII